MLHNLYKNVGDKMSYDGPAEIDDKGKELIEKVKQAIQIDKLNPERNSIIEDAMNKMYFHFAKYPENILWNINLQFEINKTERLLEKEFLPIKNEPIYDDNFDDSLPKSINNENDAKKYLDYIVHYTRKELSKQCDIRSDSLSKKCSYTSYCLEKICSKLGLDTIHFCIDEDLKEGDYHHFTILKIPLENGTFKNYLMDCTYRQFFTKGNSNPNRICAMRGDYRGCSIGYYMMQNERRKQIAETILTKGYIEATPEVLKEYFDAIVFSGRDINYYKEHGLDYNNPDDITPSLTSNEYLKIIKENKALYSKLHSKQNKESNIDEITL